MYYYDYEINAIVSCGKECDNKFQKITDEEFELIREQLLKGYTINSNEDNTLKLLPPAPKTEEQVKAELRIKRKPLLEAFDIWEKAVLRGREQDSVVIMGWYQDLLDLIPSAFENIPERVQYYL